MNPESVDVIEHCPGILVNWATLPIYFRKQGFNKMIIMSGNRITCPIFILGDRTKRQYYWYTIICFVNDHPPEHDITSLQIMCHVQMIYL